jgi:peptidylprolyl isomerase
MRMKYTALALLIVGTLMVGATALTVKANAQQAPANLENTLYLDLKDGRVVIELLPNQAPKTTARIKELARKKFYDGVVFHRVIEGFMAQGGDPTGTGTSGSGQKLPDELPTYNNAYSRGVVAMANAGRNTSDSQFFIMLADYPLQNDYTVFGKVISGMEYVDKIKKGNSYLNGQVSNPDKIIRVQVAADVKQEAAPAAGAK